MKKRILVTTALPYANGPLHLGHILENLEADIYVRFLRSIGRDVIFCCADDTHGTPIEINAMKAGMKPEEFIKVWYKNHREGFKKFLVGFDSYYSTNSKENKKFSDYFFLTLKKNGYIYKKQIEHFFCPKCKRFLPDRLVRGECPRCGAEGQYGDVCEKCGSSYRVTELKSPTCALCGGVPILKKTTHYFFKLSSFSKKLKNWLEKNEKVQSDIKNYVLEWVERGLEDWDISRDPPYFGFKIVGEKDKYYYVWLDAPIGYVSSTENYCKKHGLDAVKDYWKNKSAEIIHFIGKDIAYFHFLFWPAMLMGVNFNLPSNIIVHGFLTIEKQKLSKSKGMMITAEEYLKNFDPEHLRYYFASHLTRSTGDIDLSFSEFKTKVNNELVANVCNFIYRAISFSTRFMGGRVGRIAWGEEEKRVKEEFDELFKRVEKFYADCNLRDVVKSVNKMAEIANSYFQKKEPWKLIKNDKNACESAVAFSVNLAKNLCVAIKPIVPMVASKVEKALGVEEVEWKDYGFEFEEREIKRIEVLTKKVEGSGFFDPFSRVDIRVGRVVNVKKKGKYYIIDIDVGGFKKRVVAGIANHYKKEELEGRKLVVVCNMKEALIGGEKSNGMLLGVRKGEKVGIALSNAKVGDEVIVKGIEKSVVGDVDLNLFKKLNLRAKNGEMFYKGKKLSCKSGDVWIDGRLSGDVF